MPWYSFKEKQEEQIRITESCSRCHKPVTPTERKGSFTSYLFKENRCQCPTDSTAEEPALVVTAHPDTLAPAPTLEKPDLGDRYEVLEMIGQGGMGTVWKVHDKAIDKMLAIKILRKELASDRFAVKRFEQEARAAVDLTHVNLVAVYGYGTANNNDAPYLVMDYVDGESLADTLKREVYLNFDRVIGITSQICEALAHAHAKGIVHRDLKPSNIMLIKNDGQLDMIKIVDFGIAKVMPTVNEQTKNLTQTGDLFGSPLYMSPEQCEGESIDARSDIYSLGCVTYELLTGKAAFAAENPIKTILKQINDAPPALKSLVSVPDGLAEIVRRCLEKDPSSRYQ
ncbi:MAG: serine/threonine protein kinase, partial [Terriglobales bacterium]